MGNRKKTFFWGCGWVEQKFQGDLIGNEKNTTFIFYYFLFSEEREKKYFWKIFFFFV